MPVILETTAGTGQLIAAAIIGFAIIIALITKFKLHPFLSLTIGALAVGAIAQLSLEEILESYSTGVGSTVASVGVLIALGAIIGKLLADSGGADEIVDTLVSKASPATLPWAMALIGAVIDVLRDWLGAARPRHPAGDSPVQVAPHEGRHPGPGRPVDDARPGSAAPWPVGCHRPAEG